MSFDEKRRKLLVGTCATFIASVGSTRCWPKAVLIDYSSQVAPIDQGNANLCWLAAAAMIQSYPGMQSIALKDAASTLGAQYLLLYSQAQSGGGALDFGLVNDLAAKLNMDAFGYSSFSASWWSGKLAKGPMWVGGQNAAGMLAHVRVLIGMNGDDTNASSLTVKYIDPDGAGTASQSFSDFIAFYEGLPKYNPDLANQIFAFK